MEETLSRCTTDYCIVIVTHNLGQAARVSTITASCTWASWWSSGPRSRCSQRPATGTDDYSPAALASAAGRGAGRRPVIEGHISRAFDGELLALHVRVVAMGGLALEQVRDAARAYREWNRTWAQRVLEREPTLNVYEAEIDQEQFTLLARRQPVGSDLRIVIAMSKMVGELERAGDEAKKIARVVEVDTRQPGSATARDAQHLAQLAIDLLRKALEAIDSLDFPLAHAVIAGDKELDAEYAAGLRRLLTRAMEDPLHFESTVQAAFVLKSLERVGDHARNLARHVLSMQSAAAPDGGVAGAPPPHRDGYFHSPHRAITAQQDWSGSHCSSHGR